MSLKFESHTNWNVIKILKTLKLECHLNWIVKQIGMSLKLECHSNWKTNYIEKVVNPKTSKSASVGQILILFFYQARESSLFPAGFLTAQFL